MILYHKDLLSQSMTYIQRERQAYKEYRSVMVVLSIINAPFLSHHLSGSPAVRHILDTRICRIPRQRAEFGVSPYVYNTKKMQICSAEIFMVKSCPLYSALGHSSASSHRHSYSGVARRINFHNAKNRSVCEVFQLLVEYLSEPWIIDNCSYKKKCIRSLRLRRRRPEA